MMLECRLAKPEEAETAVSWLEQTEKNLFDPKVLGNEGTMTLCVANGEPLLFMPLQLVFFMDALGKKPGIRKRDMAVSLVKMIEGTRNLAKGLNIAEVFFFCVEDTVKAQATNFGFEIIAEDKERGITLFRMKL